MSCPSCASSSSTLIEEGVLPSGLEVRSCGGCGLEFFQGAADDDYWATPGQDDIYDEAAIAGERAEFFDEILDAVGPPSGSQRLLDVGAGKGEFSRLAAGRGWRVTAVEPSLAAGDGLLSHGVESVCNVAFEDFEASGVYACVTLLDLVEHTRDPKAVVEKAASCLAPGGLLVILTPDAGSATRRAALALSGISRGFAGLLKYQYYLPHVTYLSLATLKRYCEPAGLKIVRSQATATPKRFLLAKLENHYGKYPGNAAFRAAVGALYPLAKGMLANKLLVFARKVQR